MENEIEKNAKEYSENFLFLKPPTVKELRHSLKLAYIAGTNSQQERITGLTKHRDRLKSELNRSNELLAEVQEEIQKMYSTLSETIEGE